MEVRNQTDIRRLTLETTFWKDESLRNSILSKINELLDCVQTLGKTNCFEITVKHKNGELVTETNFFESSHSSKASTI